MAAAAWSVLDLPGVVVDADVATGGWQVALPAQAAAGRPAGGPAAGPAAGSASQYRIREWTWGERRRLVAASMRADGRLDRARFLRRLVELLADPVPEAGEDALLASVALRLLGVGSSSWVGSLPSAEAVLARTWGWGPAELDQQPAPWVDGHLRALGGQPTAAASQAGWTTIIVVADPARDDDRDGAGTAGPDGARTAGSAGDGAAASGPAASGVAAGPPGAQVAGSVARFVASDLVDLLNAVERWVGGAARGPADPVGVSGSPGPAGSASAAETPRPVRATIHGAAAGSDAVPPPASAPPAAPAQPSRGWPGGTAPPGATPAQGGGSGHVSRPGAAREPRHAAGAPMRGPRPDRSAEPVPSFSDPGGRRLGLAPIRGPNVPGRPGGSASSPAAPPGDASDPPLPSDHPRAGLVARARQVSSRGFGDAGAPVPPSPPVPLAVRPSPLGGDEGGVDPSPGGSPHRPWVPAPCPAPRAEPLQVAEGSPGDWWPPPTPLAPDGWPAAAERLTPSWPAPFELPDEDLEDRLADLLEAAALEAGIDLS
jgi:hypothetical protein